jgi:hypothetical protein
MFAFQDAPWRDDDDLVTDTRLEVSDTVEISDGDENGRWQVGGVWEAPLLRAPGFELYLHRALRSVEND